MSQLEKLVALLREFGLGDDGEAVWPDHDKFSVRANGGDQIVTIGCGEGLYGFLASFHFDADGKFKSHEVYE